MNRRRFKVPDTVTDPLWYKDAVIYELHVRSFYDSNGDGIGDFAGLTQKLGYLQNLGVTALWLLPFYPSPLKDDGYDIADYYGINPQYGAIDDFKKFLAEAHRRGMKVITELVINHTSDQHPWFQRARQAKPGSAWRNFYVWSKTPDKFGETRIIFKDFETSNWAYDSVAREYYWHRFYSHQPDLNYDNPATRREVIRAMDHWLGMGVDGMRLDAVPYLFEREGTDCENLPETHAFLKELRRHVDEKFPGRMLLAEANQWPEDAAAYFGSGDECHMNFHFPLMPRLFMGLQKEDRQPIVDILAQTPAIPATSQWAIFLRNHDELTLEMVNEEDRDYMYRTYADDRRARINLGIRRRLAPLLNNNRRRIELLNALLLSLPGTPVLYYGDELGMGDNLNLGDRNGVRTPMQWSGERNAGFSEADPERLYLPVITDPEYHYQSINVEAQARNPQQLFWWMKRLIALRETHRAFARGSLEMLEPKNRRVLAFIRRYGEERVLVVANLSRYVQPVELDFDRLAGYEVTELFGQNRFPSISSEPYPLTLGPHAFIWFRLDKTGPHRTGVQIPEITTGCDWADLLTPFEQNRLQIPLSNFLKRQRWFAGKAKSIIQIDIAHTVKFPAQDADVWLTLVRVRYSDGEPELYQIPIGLVPESAGAEMVKRHRHHLIAHILMSDGKTRHTGWLADMFGEPEVARSLAKTILQKRSLSGAGAGALIGVADRGESVTSKGFDRLPVQLGTAEQSNSSAIFGDRFILKLYRRVEEGECPEVEMGIHFTNRSKFKFTPATIGHLRLEEAARPPITLAVMQRFVPNQGDAWTYTLKHLEKYAKRAGRETEISKPSASLTNLSNEDAPKNVRDLIGDYLDSATLLGKRTAEMHLAAADSAGDPAYAPEPFTPFYKRSLYQSFRVLAGRTLHLLHERIPDLPRDTSQSAERVLASEERIYRRFRQIADTSIPGVRIRTHGDLHLGQVLVTNDDFMIIDFEGEVMRPLSERWLKRHPLRDVAAMIRSFHYAVETALRGLPKPKESNAAFRAWDRWVASRYLRGYLDRVKDGGLLRDTSKEVLDKLLNLYLLERALYELDYELNNRPNWAGIPLSGIEQLLTGRE